MGLYNYKLIYSTAFDNKRHVKTNSDSMPLERAYQEINELYQGAEEIGATILEMKIIKV